MLPVFVLLSLAASSAFAQLGVYAGLTTSKTTVPNTSRFYGGTFGAYFDASHHHLVNFGIDVRGTDLPSDNITKVKSIAAGPRVVFHVPVVPLRPYAEGLIGEAHVQTGQGVAYTDKNGLDAGFALGADLHIFPYVDWRLLDYSYSRLNAAHAYQNSITTGLVVRIPFS